MNLDCQGFHSIESEVCVYNRMFPVCFDKAEGDTVWDNQGKSYIDFLTCAGSLSYGHNPSVIKNKVIEYLQMDGMVSSLDMMTCVLVN
jgi:diaminobutyrate-2-oxoglutarate transaminase